MVRAFRGLRIVLHLIHGAWTAALFLNAMPHAKREHTIQQWSIKFMRILNVRIICSGHIPTAETRSSLFIANHISWLDIWALKSMHPINFVAKSDVRQWPVIGWLSEKTNTIFIERTRRQDTGRTASSMEQALQDGYCLCLFPEGTTTDGTELKPFKTGLLQAAVNTECMVWPVAIHYPGPQGTTNTAVAYYGEITLLESLLAVLSQREVIVELRFAEPIPALGQERRHLSHQARHAIASLLHLPKHKAPETPHDLPAEPL
jgi:1-acyl-sn-glycerol-3-phosphate acyltransferase